MPMPQRWPKPAGEPRADIETFSMPPSERGLEPESYSTGRFITGARAQLEKAGTSVSTIKARYAAAGNRDALKSLPRGQQLRSGHAKNLRRGRTPQTSDSPPGVPRESRGET